MGQARAKRLERPGVTTVSHAVWNSSTEGGDRDALYLRRTLRSGQRVDHDGNVVVFGDVHAGAEIVAAGDVLVFGHLRGVVHAGAAGAETARVCAWRLEPVQLRIARMIARSPDRGDEPSIAPELARIEDGQVVIERADRADDGRVPRG